MTKNDIKFIITCISDYNEPTDDFDSIDTEMCDRLIKLMALSKGPDKSRYIAQFCRGLINVSVFATYILNMYGVILPEEKV